MSGQEALNRELASPHARATLRSRLLPALLEAQLKHGSLAEATLREIGQQLGVPAAEVYGVASFYSLLSVDSAPAPAILCCTGPICTAKGSHALLARLRSTGKAGESGADGLVQEAPCLCLCDAAPAALVNGVPAGELDADAPLQWLENPQEMPLGKIGGSPRWLTARCTNAEPSDLTAFEAAGGFLGVQRALRTMSPEQVIAEIRESALRGRGGAAFPTGLKWSMAAEAEGGQKYVVANGDESEPGTFKDRLLMEGDPFSIIAGMLIAGYAVGADRGYIYVRGEFPRARRLLNSAIEQSRAAGYLGARVLGAEFAFEIELRSGAGAYICGEETALLESIEGYRGTPRLRPPYPTTRGLFGAPTVVNNIETLCAASWILRHSVDKFRSEGTPQSTGTKLYCLSGDIAFPGTYEAPLGTSLGDLLRMAGGPQGDLQGILLGGAAGVFLPPDALDLELSFEATEAAGAALGSGAIMVFNSSRDLRKILLSIARFFAEESCGKCYPCSLGTQRQVLGLQRLLDNGTSESEIDYLDQLAQVMTDASLCGLGTTAGLAVRSALHHWPRLFDRGREIGGPAQ